MNIKRRQRIRQGLILLSFFLFPAIFYYFSPAVILRASSEGVINGSWVMFALLFFSSLLLGRGFCGWVCPGAGNQEALFAVHDKRVTGGDWIKWLIWVPWIGAIAYLAWRAGGYIKVDLLYMTTHGFSIGNLNSLITYLVVHLVLISLPCYLVGRRAFCHHLCWMAPFMILGRKLRNLGGWPSLHLKTQGKCIHCDWCTQACPMSLPVEKMVTKKEMEHAECILCGSCADSCPKEVIHLCFSSFRKD